MENQSVMQQAVTLLKNCGGQEAVIEFLNSKTGEAQTKLAQQLLDLDKVTPKGIVDYC
jgi:UDP-sugar pyrophosphorylase